MDVAATGTKLLSRLDPRVASLAERSLKRIPAVRRALDREYDRMLAAMEPRLKPYREQLDAHIRLPVKGVAREDVFAEMKGLAAKEDAVWREGYVSGAVYQGDRDHVGFLNGVYAAYSQANPLHSDLFPSVTKYEAEVVAMTAAMLGADHAPGVCGTVSSGGTESILLAMKTYRDRARATKGVTRPEVAVPSTAHTAFDKAGQCFGINVIRVPVHADTLKADVEATRRAITRRTVALVGSAPCFPYGTIDPIEDLSELARSRHLGFHTDACMGGFILPWAEQLGYDVPPFDFRLPGVTSMSADTHKFGYAAKGTSVVLYRTQDIRHYQYFVFADWPGGLYCSPTLAGSRPGALSAACWAAMVTIGEEGYLASSRRILEAAATVRRGVESIPELRTLGDGLWIVAFASRDPRVDVYRVLDAMSERGWHLIGLQRPAALHICLTARQARPGVPERFVADLRASVAQVRSNPGRKGGMAPVYGMADTIPFRGIVGDMLKRYMDLLYRP